MSKKRAKSNREILESAFGVVFKGREENPLRRPGERRLSEAEERRYIKHSKLYDRVEAMRPYFGDLFKASNGYHLGKIGEWSRAQVNKVNKYWQVMAPLVSRPHKARYYRRKDHLDAAIVYSQQEQFLKGQTAALFDMNRDEVLKVRFTRSGEIQVRRGGVSVRKVYFNPVDLISDPIETVRDAAAELKGARRFKLIMGPHESRGYFKTVDSLLEGIAAIQSKYSDDEYDEDDEHSHYYANWLFGLIGYYGQARDLDDSFNEERKAREAAVKSREKERYNQRIQRRARMWRAKHGSPKK